MKAAGLSLMIPLCQTTWCYILQDYHLHAPCAETTAMSSVFITWNGILMVLPVKINTLSLSFNGSCCQNDGHLDQIKSPRDCGATRWTVLESNSGIVQIFYNRPEWPSGPPSLLYNGYWVSIPGCKAAGPRH